MTKELAEFLALAAQENDQEVKIYKNYSGRGMFGRTTYGVTCDSASSLLSAVLEYFKNNIVETEDEEGDSTPSEYEGKNLSEIEFSEFSTDNMGRDKIILY